jgi:hypothetical protein
MPRREAGKHSMEITTATEYLPSIIPAFLRAASIDLLGPWTALSLQNRTGMDAQQPQRAPIVSAVHALHTYLEGATS